MRNRPQSGPLAPGRRGPDRYAAKGNNRPWADAEDRAACAVLLACETSAAFDRACILLCEALDRAPARGPNARPDRLRFADDCRGVLESRRWKLLAGYKGWRPDGWPVYRDDVPLTWTEVKYFLGTWTTIYTKTSSVRLPEESLVSLLGRAKVDFRAATAMLVAGVREGRSQPRSDGRLLSLAVAEYVRNPSPSRWTALLWKLYPLRGF